MRFLSFLLLFFCFSQALEISQIKITPSLKKIEISLPSKERFQTSNQEHCLLLTFSSPLIGESLTQKLQSPFEQITISNNSQNKAQITLCGKNLELSIQKGQEESVLSFSSEILQVSWGSYFSVIGFLGAMIIVLYFVRKKLKLPTQKIHYSEIHLKARAKLIALEYEGEKYLIFSNQKGCTLLNHYPKTKDNKEFTDLIKEE
ncbi:hypothetical protein [Helicobacter brantae]|uniref:Uncharacterized protein n=1 Tax=Helicobacter brantae TaxID=375927 RepID=A0A3D8J582_9HELI|nr:hypothetical protein [Helicobacter brantae]RDU72064.1 hypothetical protein CQA58_00220 [Helicobacter brantae]